MAHSGQQMPQRPRSHEVEDLSRNRLHDAFNGVGWTVENLRKDYGEDLLVRIFDNGIATPLSFFVQAKGTDAIQNYASATGPICVPLKREHVNHWREFSEPVIVALWDSKADRIYWNCVQTYFSTEEGKTALAAATEMLRIPVNLPLDATGLLWVHSITKSRFERSQDERQGVQALIDLLKEHLKLEIEYDTRGVVYVTPPGEAPIVGLFGRTAEHFDDLAKHWGCSFEQAYRIVFKTIHELTESGPKERKVLTEMFYALSEIERHGQDFSAFVEVKSRRRRKPRTKPGPPDIEELKQLLVPRRKKSRRNDLPGLFTSPGPTTVGESPQNESESCD
jgi:Domain of unknown function (DUF4365)